MHTLIVGGGLAGLAAAVTLGQRGINVTLLEARQRLGGRAGSFHDTQSDQLIDACQHVAMGCCTHFLHFCDTVGVKDLLDIQHALYFMTPDQRVSRFAADIWPAPFHLGRALWGATYLTVGEKLRIGYGLMQLMRLKPTDDQPLIAWLKSNRQTERTIARFWSITLTSALNESIDRVGTKYARKVFADGFINDREAWKVWVPKVPLGELYGERLRSYLSSHNVTILENHAVRQLRVGDRPGVTLRDGREMHSDHVILAVPYERVRDLLPESIREHDFFRPMTKLQASPITSVHLWTDRPFSQLPHVVFVDCLSQWIFFREMGSEYYSQVVVSAARDFQGVGRDEILSRVVAELRSLFPEFRHVNLLRSRIVTEHHATFSAVPGIDEYRLPQRTPFPGLTLAGDWTQTEWPATMEGAVISGELAAEVVMPSPLSTSPPLPPARSPR